MTTVRRMRTAALCGAMPLALLVAGCGGSGGDAKPSEAAPAASQPAPAPASSSAAPKDPDAAQKRAVLAAYASMWGEQMKAYKVADATGTDLKRYAALTALSKLRLDLAQMKKSGTRGTGTLGHEPTVMELKTDGKLPTATLQDCIDLSQWKAVRTSGEPVPLPSNQPRRYLATAKAEQWPGGWMITDYTPNGARTC
ncbi:hypothetical protein [Streptomyces sp. NBC_01789]|uniref:hypothetical protein n=1 Tax=Streptomyces sp. NBC_01789 TaxID=2975941 RepID=UPI002254AA6E|nr:hypothetical protein [Streptomyces sp. NBC_01789]MCX4451759.1 hypothetical protein [Streptomyces sp. NBC_01789]